MEGWISTYWAQGMEGEVWFIFQDERYASGDQWQMEGLHQIAPGQHLTIFDAQGQVLWRGLLKLRKQGWFGRHTLVPPEVGEERWEAWFRHSPPLRARYGEN